MKLNIGDKICGFTVDRARENKAVGGVLYELCHDKTGALVCFVDNGEENKLFSICFKTTPEDDTGVFHILEHSVLNGSEKYPVREPFVELLKSSMNTFLNALTYPDRTVYPVSSRNEKDFINLMSVYLDGVFAPRILNDKNIFYQEGRHLEIDENGARFNGVVLNEMKGAMSSPDSVVDHCVRKYLFSDTCYAYNSGGEPSAIPELSYESFIDTYKRFYHPSNARIFLDGDIPLEKTLGIIDGYFSNYDRLNELPVINKQIPTNKFAVEYYELDDNDGAKDIISFSKIVCDYDDTATYIATRILADYLVETNDSPLRRRIIEEGLGEDVDICVTTMNQTYIQLDIRNTSVKKIDKIKQVIGDTISEIVRNKIDEKDLIACINHREFAFKKPYDNEAIKRALNSFDTWLYGGDVLDALDYSGAFSKVREMVGTGEFEQLLETIFSPDGLTELHVLPKSGLLADNEKKAVKYAEKIAANMSDDERKSVIRENEELSAWQQTPDSEEALATLPTLSLDDVPKSPKLYKTEESVYNGCTVLYHNLPTNGVVHASIYAPVAAVNQDDLPYITLMSNLLGELPTENYSVTELQLDIKTYIGSIDFDICNFSERGDVKNAKPYFVCRISTLEQNLDKSLEIVAEILTKTDFTCRGKIKEILSQSVENNRQYVIESGHSVALSTVRASFSARGAAQYMIDGFGSIMALKSFSEHFDDLFDHFTAVVNEFTLSVYTKNNIIISITNTDEKDLSKFIDSFKSGEKIDDKRHYEVNLSPKMGIKIPSQVSYVAKGYCPLRLGIDPDMSVRVAAHIETFSYLWNKVRVQGGAYGVGLSLAGDDGLYSYTFRDPSPEKSLDTFDNMGDFLRECADGGESIDKYIISTVSSTNPLQTALSEGISADSAWFGKITDERLCEMHRQMVETTPDKLKNAAKLLDEMAKQGRICIVGGAESLKNCGELTVYEL